MNKLHKLLSNVPNVFKIISLTFSTKVSGAFLAFFIQLTLARQLSNVEFGKYTVVFTWLNILMIIATLGLDRLSIRVSSLKESGLYKNFHKGALLSILSSSILIALLYLFFYHFFNRSGLEFNTQLLGATILPFLALNQFNSTTLQGLKMPIQGEFFSQVLRQLLFFIAFLLVAFVFKLELDAEMALILLLLSTLITFLISLISISRRKVFISDQPISINFSWLKESFSFMIINGAQLIRKNIDIIIVGYMLGVEMAGFYAATTRITNLISFGTGAINTVISPIIAENYSNHKINAVAKTVSSAGILILVYSLVALLVIIFSGEFVLSLFGDEFIITYPVLILLAVSQLINALFGPTGTLAAMTKNQKYSSRVIAISAIINIILNFIFISLFDLIGAAIANIITNIFWNSLIAFYLYKKIHINSIVFLSSYTKKS